tara:strand:+ start:126 stop:266 length:141 start_codon:yes stop_codon:yes gene_type:complete
MDRDITKREGYIGNEGRDRGGLGVRIAFFWGKAEGRGGSSTYPLYL